MKITRIALCAAVFLMPYQATARERADVLIRHAAVVDVEHARIIPDQAIAIEGDTIRAVGPDRSLARKFAAPRTIDAAGKFVMPGLWDMHVHFGGEELIGENKALLPLYVAFGVTTVRDCAEDISASVLEWRSGVAEGRLLGPTIYTSGPKLEGYKPIWKGTIEVGTPAEVDAALDRLQAMKVDFVKITDNTLKPEIFLYAVKAAKSRGLKTSAHTPYALTIEQAATAGLNSVEHLDYLIKAGSPQEASIGADFAAKKLNYGEASDKFVETFDPNYAVEEYRRLAALGVYVTPTLNMSRILAYLDREDHSGDAALAYVGPGLRKTYQWRVERAAKATSAQVEARHREYELSLKVLPMLRDAGIPILAGTDAGYLNSFNYPGEGLHEELERYVEAGLTPQQALVTATITGPAFLGHSDRYGGLADGKAADILVLDANPLNDVKATRAIRGVMLHGQWLDRAALDKLLADAKATAAR
ncbi:amidohydrolase family protein [Sphingomonas sp. G124]|uniref:Amidohydrolase family protein n=1 Tax=Sphingomonas cremea TaxID=2904799 RepID=A0A9X1TWZ6_9SPHN|nr:amidohydrolase family protein [Sphingomonas cremea]MCF2514600.1 amidohydrolase family protein [Sphingomonas cremea]